MLLENGKAPHTVTVLEGQRGKENFLSEDTKSIGRIAKESQVLLQAALGYAAKGFPVFPCRPSQPNAKQPLVAHGFKSASTNPEQISAWWAQWPDALIGVPTGAVSGFWALDIDAPKKEGEASGFASYMELISLHDAPDNSSSQLTPSSGQHIFFRYTSPIKNSAGKVGAKIDVRGDGGYVIMAPSAIHGVGAYKARDGFLDNIPDAPAWLYALATAEPSHKPVAASLDGTPYGLKALEDECASLAATYEGQRNDALTRSAFRMGQLISGQQLSFEKACAELLAAIQAWGPHETRKGADTISRQLREGMKYPKAPEAKKASGGNESPKKQGPTLTEDILAMKFAAAYQGRFLYCNETGAWFQWDGVSWQRERKCLTLHLVRELCRRENEDGKPSIGKLLTARGVLGFAQADPAFSRTAEIWDTDPMLLGTPGGTVDLKTGQLRPAEQEEYITRLAGVIPANSPDCPIWRNFLHEATRGDQELQRFLQQVAGYCLTGNTREHALFFVYGPGGNGKSVFLNTLTTILADYATTSAMSTFTSSNSDQHPTDLAMLRGARLVSVSETEEGRAWAESRIKQMTGGDKITARFMRQDFFEYIPQFKLLIVGNHAPTLRNVDDAARRRFNIIPFVHRPAQPDSELENKLKAELPAIMRWAIDGCLDWQKHGLVRPQSVIDATAEYFDSQDLFGRWLEDCCERGPKLWTETKELYASWTVYAKRNGEEPGDVRKFGPLLSKTGFVPHRTNMARGFKGLSLKRQEEWQDNYDK